MPEWFAPTLLVLIALVVLWLALRRADTSPTERLERELRDEIARQAQASRATPVRPHNGGDTIWKFHPGLRERLKSHHFKGFQIHR